jgi:hypothetical protein
MAKEQLIKKVYRCIDETYPDTTEQDLEEFNISAFLDEAVRWVVNVVPVGALGGGVDKTTDANPEEGEEGDVSLSLGEDFLRLIEFKMKGWKTSVTQALSQDNPKYWQQQNPALRGGNSRPVVFLVNSSFNVKKLEVYPLSDKVEVFRVFEMETYGDGSYTDSAYTNYPYKLLDITAWKTAELVFSMMQDANGVSVAQAHIQQILPTL